MGNTPKMNYIATNINLWGKVKTFVAKLSRVNKNNFGIF